MKYCCKSMEQTDKIGWENNPKYGYIPTLTRRNYIGSQFSENIKYCPFCGKQIMLDNIWFHLNHEEGDGA